MKEAETLWDMFLTRLVWIIVMASIFIVMASICSSIQSYYRKEAIQRGYAEWVVNQDTGKTTWQWIEPKKQ